MGSPEQNKALVLQFMERLGAGDVAGAAGCFDSERYYSHQHEADLAETWERMKQRRRDAALTDVENETLAVLADGDRVVAHSLVTATHTGHFYGLPPTGNRVTLSALETWRVEGDKIVEHWGGLVITPSVWERLGATA